MVLALGLMAVFVGLSATMVVATNMGRERSQVRRQLAAIDNLGVVPEDMLSHAEPSFSERVTKPTAARLVQVSRKVTPSDWNARVQALLDLAGNPVGWDPERILAAKSGLTIALGGGMALLYLMNGNVTMALIFGVIFGALGFYGPDLILRSKARGRSKRLRKELPDAVDLLGICVESGSALDAAMAQVAANTDGPLSQEFTRVLHEIQIGKSRTQALRDLAERTDVDDLRIFIGALVQAEGLGIPVVEMLRVQTGEMRLKRTQRAEEQAVKLPVKLVFPTILLIMPAMFIVIIGPAIIKIADSFRYF